MAKKRGLYKSSRGTLLPAPRKDSLPLPFWVLLGVGGMIAGWNFANKFLIRAPGSGLGARSSS